MTLITLDKLKEGYHARCMEILETYIKERGCLTTPIPTRFAGAAFNNLDWIRPVGALEYARTFAASPMMTAPPVLSGKCGTGKTTLAYAIINELPAAFARFSRHHYSNLIKEAIEACLDEEELSLIDFKPRLKLDVKIVTGPELAWTARVAAKDTEPLAAYKQGDFGRGYERGPCDWRILLVDDIEVYKGSEWLDQELYGFFDYRYRWGLPTIVSTNLSPKDLKGHVLDKIFRRIVEPAQLIVMETPTR